jgi:hypothetical protein
MIPERIRLATSMIFGDASESFSIPEASTQEALGIWTLEHRPKRTGPRKEILEHTFSGIY